MRTPAVAGLAFAAAFLVGGVALGGDEGSKQDGRTLAFRLSAVDGIPALAEDPAVAARERAQARRAAQRRLRGRRAAARRAAARERRASAPATEEPVTTTAPEPVAPPVAPPAPPPRPAPPPPPDTFDDSG